MRFIGQSEEGRGLASLSIIGASLQGDLDRLGAAGIPTDIIIEQGVEVLGLN